MITPYTEEDKDMLFTIIFFALLLSVFGRLAWFAVKLTWSLTKFLVFVVFLPLIIVGLFIQGIVTLAFPLVIIAGILSLIFVRK